MRRVFTDTSALVALRDGADARHEAATSWLGEALAGANLKLVLTNYVLAEVHAFFCRTPSMAFAYARKIQEDSRFEIARASSADETAAWAILAKSRDKTYSFTDAVSFAAMRRLGLSEALAFDDHFRQAGFRVLP